MSRSSDTGVHRRRAKDSRVPVTQAEALVKALKANDTPVGTYGAKTGSQQLTAPTNDFSIYTWVMLVRKFILE